MHYLVGVGFDGYAVVKTDAAVATMVASNMWRKVGYAEYMDMVRRIATSLPGARFFIRADGRHATVANDKAAQGLLDHDYYEVEPDDYKQFVARKHGITAPLLYEEEGDDVA